MNYFVIALISYVNIFLRAQQQLNVVWKKYLWVLPTSMIMAACEVFVIASVVSNANWQTAIALGIGAGLGCMTSMATHKKLTGKGMGNKKDNGGLK